MYTLYNIEFLMIAFFNNAWSCALYVAQHAVADKNQLHIQTVLCTVFVV